MLIAWVLGRSVYRSSSSSKQQGAREGRAAARGAGAAMAAGLTEPANAADWKGSEISKTNEPSFALLIAFWFLRFFLLCAPEYMITPA